MTPEEYFIKVKTKRRMLTTTRNRMINSSASLEEKILLGRKYRVQRAELEEFMEQCNEHCKNS